MSDFADAVRGSARGSLILMIGGAVSNLTQALGVIFIARVLSAAAF